MVFNILLLLVVHAYAICEGITEASVWEMRDNQVKINTGKYHFYRAIETIAIFLMPIMFVFIVNYVVDVLILGAVCFLMYILPYRVAFIRRRGQKNIMPSWDYDIEIFGKLVYIKYPSLYVVIFSYVSSIVTLFVLY